MEHPSALTLIIRTCARRCAGKGSSFWRNMIRQCRRRMMDCSGACTHKPASARTENWPNLATARRGHDSATAVASAGRGEYERLAYSGLGFCNPNDASTVFLSEASAARSAAEAESKDPENPCAKMTAARHSDKDFRKNSQERRGGSQAVSWSFDLLTVR